MQWNFFFLYRPWNVLWEPWSKLRLCSANHRADYFSNLTCGWLSIVWAYSHLETENGPSYYKVLSVHSRIGSRAIFSGGILAGILIMPVMCIIKAPLDYSPLIGFIVSNWARRYIQAFPLFWGWALLRYSHWSRMSFWRNLLHWVY